MARWHLRLLCRPNGKGDTGVRRSTVKRHLADLRARSGLTIEQLIYVGHAAGWLVVPSLEAGWSDWYP